MKLMEIAEKKKNIGEVLLKSLSNINHTEGNEALSLARNEALESLTDVEFPTTKAESWKYTRTTKLSKSEFQENSFSSNYDLAQYQLGNWTGAELVFENGKFNSEKSNLKEIDGVKFINLQDASQEWLAQFYGNVSNRPSVFSSINTAYVQDGTVIIFEKGKKATESIHILNLVDGNNTLAVTRNLIIAEESSEGSVVESFYSLSKEKTWTNRVSEIVVKENANLSYDKLQHEQGDSFHLATDEVIQGKNSTFSINTITTNGLWVRNNLNIDVNGQNCMTNLFGTYILNGKQHVDNHTIVDHKVAHCESNELYKGVIDDHATAVFNGKVFVRKDAQKINAFQNNGNVLLSDTATVNSKPELEIYADDVKCSHGSTIGQLDEEAVFYLRARGVGEKNARQLLVAAFIGDVLNNIKNDAVRAKVDALLLERFGWEF